MKRAKLAVTAMTSVAVPSDRRKSWKRLTLVSLLIEHTPVSRACQDCAANLQVGSGMFAGTNQVLGAQVMYRYGRRHTQKTPAPGVEYASGTARGCRGILG